MANFQRVSPPYQYTKMKLSIFYLFIITSSFVYSQIVDETGSAQFPYKPSGFSGKPKTEEINSAIKAAKLNALSRYIADMDQNSRMNFQKIQSSIEADIDRVIQGVSIIRNDYDKKKKMIFITLRASINSSLIQDRLVQVGPASQLPPEDKKYVVGAFVSRIQTSVTAFDQKRVIANRDDSFSEEFEEVASNGVSTSISADQRKEKVMTSSGSSTVKSDEILWDISTAESFENTVSGILTTAGYMLIPANSLVDSSAGLINMDAVSADYSSGNDLSPATRSDLMKGCSNLKLTYLSTGTLTVQAPERHPVTGETKVTVSVNIQVSELRQLPFGVVPVVVASIPSQLYSALGSNQTTAKESAIKLAAQKAGQLIVAGLQKSNAK
jgi:hypothetical protein